MALTGTIISGKVKLILQDETSIRWTESELLGWINSALNEILIHKPNACVKNKVITTVAGSKQSITATDLQFMEAYRTVGGKSITSVNRDVLDTTIPDWHKAAAGEARHYVFDPRDPKTFYLYPPSAGGASIEAMVAASPAALGSIDSTIELDDVYEGAITDYVLYRAFSKDSEHTSNMSRSTGHYQVFVTALTGKMRGEITFAPKAKFGNLPQGAVDQQQQG